MVSIDISDRGTSMDDNSVRLTRSSGAGGRSSWSATGAVLCPRHVRNNSIEVLDLARDPGLLYDTDALGVNVTGQASRAVSRGTLDSSVPQVVKSTRFCSYLGRLSPNSCSWTRPDVYKPALFGVHVFSSNFLYHERPSTWLGAALGRPRPHTPPACPTWR